MKDVMLFVGSVVLVLVLAVGLLFGLSAIGLVHMQVFGPRFQAVEREIYEQTPSYVQGKEQALAELRLEYNKAKDAGEKSNIRSMIVNEAATVDLNLLKDRSLSRFVQNLRED